MMCIRQISAAMVWYWDQEETRGATSFNIVLHIPTATKHTNPLTCSIKTTFKPCILCQSILKNPDHLIMGLWSYGSFREVKLYIAYWALTIWKLCHASWNIFKMALACDKKHVHHILEVSRVAQNVRWIAEICNSNSERCAPAIWESTDKQPWWICYSSVFTTFAEILMWQPKHFGSFYQGWWDL